MSNLSARWTHAEREGIVVDRMGHADISGWSRGTTKAVRPEPSGPQMRVAPAKVSNLRQLGYKPILGPFLPHTTQVVIPSDSGKLGDVAKAIKSCDEAIEAHTVRFAYDKMLMKATKGKLRKRAPLPAIVAAPSKGLLDDCPATDLEVIAQLRTNEVPRE